MEIADINCCCEEGEKIKENIEEYTLETSESGEKLDGPYIDMFKSEDSYTIKIYCEEHSPPAVR